MLDWLDRWTRRLGGLAGLAVSLALYSGLVMGARHAKGRSTEDAPEVARAFARGSATAVVPSTVLGLGALYLMWRPIRVGLSAPVRLAALVAGSILYFPGLAIMLWGRLTLGRMHNVSTSRAVQLFADHELVTSGPFAHVRHPMYVGGIMAELGALLLYRTWTTLLLAMDIPNLVMRSRREEEALAAEFGEAWADYAGRVPGWLPRLGT